MNLNGNTLALLPEGILTVAGVVVMMARADAEAGSEP